MQFRHLAMRSAFVSALLIQLSFAAEPIRSVAERSGFTQTGRYEEVITLCNQFQKTYPKFVRCLEFGRSPEGRPMLALIASRTGVLQAEAAHLRNLPVTLIQGGIHSGEIDGKDAGFLALRELLDTPEKADVLSKQVLVFVPVFNVDGHERYGRWNRPNQRGPEEMGRRTTAQNTNLNRDYMKVDAPEMQAMLRLVQTWDPLATIDLHVTDGAKFEHDVSIQVEPLKAGDASLRADGLQLRDAVIADLARAGSLPLSFYPSFITEDDPSSGIIDEPMPARFSTGYFWLRNRFAMLVETHSWKDYPTRVNITRNTIHSVLKQVAQHGLEWRKHALAADVIATQLGGQPVTLSYAAGNAVRNVAFRGYRYSRTLSDISGALMTRYDEQSPEIWQMPVRDQVAPSLTVTAPRAGYLVPAAHAAMVAAKLSAHGIFYRTLPTSSSAHAVEVFRANQANFAVKSFEGHQGVSLQGQWAAETMAFRAGSLFVPINQSRARLLMSLLEPQAPDSLAAWGYFNQAFEVKEDMEAYVAEEVAREQLQRDPALAVQFAQKLANEPGFAKDPSARLEFFARRHASWDNFYNLYPVYRTAVLPK